MYLGSDRPGASGVWHWDNLLWHLELSQQDAIKIDWVVQSVVPAMVGYTEASPASSCTLQMPHKDTVSASGVLLTALPVPPWGPAHSPGRPPAAPSEPCCIHVLCYVCHPRLLNQAPLTGQSSQPHPENWGCPHTDLISISWYTLQIAPGQINTKYDPVNIMPARHAYRSKTVAVPICNAAVRQN